MAGAGRTMRFAEGSMFPPVAEYAFLSDRQVQALVASSGSVEWLCLPRPDSPSVFGAMLDRSAGHDADRMWRTQEYWREWHLIQAELRQQRGFSMAHQIVT